MIHHTLGGSLKNPGWKTASSTAPDIGSPRVMLPSPSRAKNEGAKWQARTPAGPRLLIVELGLAIVGNVLGNGQLSNIEHGPAPRVGHPGERLSPTARGKQVAYMLIPRFLVFLGAGCSPLPCCTSSRCKRSTLSGVSTYVIVFFSASNVNSRPFKL